jgi:hypothetical protein
MKKTDTDQQDTAQATGERSRVRSRKPKAEEFYIFFCPEGKTGPRVKKGSLPLDIDFEEHIEERTDLEPGLYRIEKRKGGEFPKEVCYYTKDELLEPIASPRDDERGETDEPEDFEETEGLSASQIVKLVASTVNATLDARERNRRAEKSEPSALDIAREIEELAEKRAERERTMRTTVIEEVRGMFQPTGEKNQAQTATEIVDSALNIVNTLREASDELSPPRERGGKVGTIGQLASLVEQIGKHGHKVLPMLGALLPGGAGMAGAAPARQQQQPSPVQSGPTSQPEQSIESEEGGEQPATLEGVLRNLTFDIQEGNPPEGAVIAAIRLVSEHPEILPMVAEIIDTPNNQLLALLHQLTGADLTIVADAENYLNKLRAGLKKRIKFPSNIQLRPAQATENGNNANA